MRDFISIAKPTVGEEEIEAVGEVLRSGMLTQGEKVKNFEDEFSEYLGVDHSIAVGNGTIALDLALKGLGIRAGDEVISPAFTFIATANAILYQGAVPVFADVDRKTFNIDPDDLAEKITPRTRAVIGVHLYGQPIDLKAVAQICEDHKIALVEDCAQAHGARYKDEMVGSFGTGCFSFYPTKNMTTGEGGMITTNDDALANRLRLLRNHGDSGKYNHISLGYNYRMTNIQGAIGSVQLKRLEGFIARRIENARALNNTIKIDGLRVPFQMADVRHVYNQYVLMVEDDSPVSREKLMEYLQASGIATAVHYPKAVYEQPLYREMGLGKDICPVSEDISRRVMSLPVHPSLSASDLEYIADTLNCFED
ncbi:MAG: DegT/DnrJ/EryC1/StrS family aminotransferase [Methanothrix sp.]|jgi:perosamine synthetase|uniref:DegT/DnrJ/EryC1/StrS family aminotransferase n=1 Tax=Methanothrix sp. TaxID=90426 RepID=UPI0025E7640F|nr:DegT/DnrJ/EryC1/StrS family aminotransferase [Methanothrix sp.]MBK7385441.1 DegT/DnrJ/EryC1/StrS family aminotransferase [Methanothrix sp.]HPW72977.1 DegT/DnrJ/EryC1/StrS family aminotransferase [Methanothrix sp.]